MQSPFDGEQTNGSGEFRGYAKDRIGVYKAFKRNMIQRSKTGQSGYQRFEDQPTGTKFYSNKESTMEVLPKWVVNVMEVQQIDKKIEEQMEEIEVLMKARDKDTFKHALEARMMPADEKLLKKIAETQRAIREKEEILGNFREHGYDLGGIQNHIIDNIYTRFSFANTKNQNMFLTLDEDLKEVKESYQAFKVQKQYTRNSELDERQQDIERLSENMKLINRMFRDVQEVIYVQGEVVDRIDYNIANADRNVVSANKELDQILERYRGFAMKFQIGLLIGIYVLLVLLLYRWL